MPRDVLLVGGGHAHVEVIRRYGKNPIRDTRLTVIDPNPYPIYSGMVPGFVAGQYERSELEIDLRALCERAGAHFIEQAVVQVGNESVGGRMRPPGPSLDGLELLLHDAAEDGLLGAARGETGYGRRHPRGTGRSTGGAALGVRPRSTRHQREAHSDE